MKSLFINNPQKHKKEVFLLKKLGYIEPEDTSEFITSNSIKYNILNKEIQFNDYDVIICDYHSKEQVNNILEFFKELESCSIFCLKIILFDDKQILRTLSIKEEQRIRFVVNSINYMSAFKNRNDFGELLLEHKRMYSR